MANAPEHVLDLIGGWLDVRQEADRLPAGQAVRETVRCFVAGDGLGQRTFARAARPRVRYLKDRAGATPAHMGNPLASVQLIGKVLQAGFLFALTHAYGR
ncbi:hypothetical protein GCM10027176_51560 [Actinoallomurus bryophytorum]